MLQNTIIERMGIPMKILRNISVPRRIIYSILALLVLAAAAYWLVTALAKASYEDSALRHALESAESIRDEWNRYVETNVEPFRAKLREVEPSDELMFRELQVSTFGDYTFGDYLIIVKNPSQLEPDVYENRGFVSIKLSGHDGFEVFLRRYFDHPATYSVGITIANDENGINMHESATDSDGNALPRNPDGSEELHLRWLEAIEENKEIIEDMFSVAGHIFEGLW